MHFIRPAVVPGAPRPADERRIRGQLLTGCGSRQQLQEPIEIYHRAGSKTFFGLGWEGGSTKVSLKHIWHPSGFRSWLNGQFYRRRNAHRMFEGLINNLRKALSR